MSVQERNMNISFKASRDVIIRTSRFEEAKAFYGQVLQLPVAYESDALVGYEAGNFRLYVEKGSDLGVVFDFIVPDAVKAREKLIAAGCEVFEEEPNVPRIYVRDPFGLLFNIAQAAPMLASS
jgi:catechol 2,3-dioxygenase-like lactoylglutathione lyase family enzyme